jgi:thiamine kinase-like enzyme
MNKQAIPAEHVNYINSAVQSGLNTDSWEIMSILSGGLTGDPVYKISVLNKQYVVKFENAHDENFDLHRNYTILKVVSEHGLSPGIYFTDPDHGVILMDYIEHKPQLQNPSIAIQQLTNVIRKLHSMTLFPKWKSVTEILLSIYQKFPVEYKQNELIEYCMDKIDDIEKILFDKIDIRSCHCDLNPVNILFNGDDYYFIDWQPASPQSFYFDLAYCANWFYFYSEELMALFLNTYLQRNATDEESAKFYLMRVFVYIYLGIGFLSIPLKSNSSFAIKTDLNSLSSYQQFMQALGSGRVNLGDPDVQQQFGFIFLSTAKSLMNERYKASYQLLLNK